MTQRQPRYAKYFEKTVQACGRRLLGVESGIDPAPYDAFNRTGVSHIIVISDFNITVIAGILTSLAGRVLDLPRGEAVLIVTPDDQQVLVDGGPSPTGLLAALGRQMPFYDRQLELAARHPAGVVSLSREGRTGEGRMVNGQWSMGNWGMGEWLTVNANSCAHGGRFVIEWRGAGGTAHRWTAAGQRLGFVFK